MNLPDINFDIYAMAKPKTRADCIAVAREIIAELKMVEEHIDAAIARCKGDEEEK